MNADYDKVLEFFNDHEIEIYGFGPTDYGAKEGTLLWCIKALDDIYNNDISTYSESEEKILKSMCTLIDIYEGNSDDASYTYYEIWNTTSERTSECTERCVDLETAKEHLANAHCDWYRPAGTGRIYGVTLTPTDDGSITMVRTMVYENK